MSENSIKFSLSNSEQRDSWLNSSHWTLDADNFSILFFLISSSSSFLSIFSNLFFPFSFHFFQFLSNRPQYSLLNLLSSYLYSIFAIYLPSNSPFLSSLLFLLFFTLPILPYSSLNSLTKSSVFPRFSLGS